jgi:hypothetical protein
MSTINESTVKLNDQKYVLTTIKDNKGFGLHFIPDSKTLDIPKNTQVDTITAALKKAMPALGDSIWYSINNDASGLVFYINGYDYTDTIAKELNKLGAIKTESELEEAVDTGAYRRLVITSPKHKLIQTGAEKYLTQNAHMYPDLTFKVMTSPKPNTIVIDLVGNKATVVGIKLQDLAERLDKTVIVVVRKEKKLGVKESVITEAEAPLYKNWNEFVNPDYIMVHLKDGRKLQINKKNVAGGQRVYQAILQAFSDERTDITNKIVAAMASMLGGTLKN